MMDLIALILKTYFEGFEIDPSSVTEMEIVPHKVSERWMDFAVHVQPEQSWFANISYFHGEWMAEMHDYIVTEKGRV